ncbi:hypothetical protein IAQ61_001023 [Plenodomus lingam]|uniref:Similar to DNA repair protein Rad1 n=1 Tax=Leptosphaeria maculans (strain JN3 / isolate v23.1.3 / race Av1-4-5-6-7-8) TaxID=985895 RepID=E5A2I5_LEPMJ|nr:similar to DNA repair protein Rad1 [Plenodomus lingam JN3]KAH9880729.1 hypothetical protein IAQ61_001023 [Plenodomus lingam]CBX97781.1 similar to DNA repair protein Rad1 [Plenodomus lingam JN3]
MDQEEPPILTAVSSSARQLFLLLRCIAFSTKAYIQLSEVGLQVSVDEASSMGASAFLDKSLFTTYTYHAPPLTQHSVQDSDDSEDDTEPTSSTPTFQISLPALLETLQIFGLTDPSSSKPSWARDNPYPTSTAFSNNVLGMNNLCRISYAAIGAPFSITLTEASIRTQCDLTTYESANWVDVPFDPLALACKIIMPASHLFDAISELSATSPEKLVLYARTVRGKPFLAFSAQGTLGSARVEFSNQHDNAHPKTRNSIRTSTNAAPATPIPATLFETFQLSDTDSVLRCTFKFSLVQKAARTMSVARKVSLRIDAQGVLSLNFMVAVEGSGHAVGGSAASASVSASAAERGAVDEKVNFVHFKFVPLVEEDEGDDEDGGLADETVMMGVGGENEGSEGDEYDEL